MFPSVVWTIYFFLFHTQIQISENHNKRIVCCYCRLNACSIGIIIICSAVPSISFSSTANHFFAISSPPIYYPLPLGIRPSPKYIYPTLSNYCCSTSIRFQSVVFAFTIQLVFTSKNWNFFFFIIYSASRLLCLLFQFSIDRQK